MRRPSMSRLGWALNGLLLIVLAGTGTVAVRLVGNPATTATAARTTIVSRGDVAATVSASGNLSAQTSIGTNFQGSGGTVTAINVAVGQTVAQGQALASIDPTTAQQNLQSAQIQVATAKAQLETTQQGQSSQDKARDQAQVASSQVGLTNAQSSLALDRTQQDATVATAQSNYNASPTSQLQAALTAVENARDSALLRDNEQVSSAQAALRSAEASVAANAQPARQGTLDSVNAQIASAQIKVAQAQTALDQTTLVAPVAGTVTSISGKVGTNSSAGGSSSSSSTTTSSSTSSSSSSSSFLTLSDMSKLQVTSMVAEADASKISPGQAATITFSAVSKTAAGSVTAVDSQSTVSNNVVEYGVTVILGTPPAGIKLGQTASVHITTASHTGVLMAPSSALTKVGNTSTATVRVGGKDTTTVVQTGVVGDTDTEILGGLAVGDVLVIPTGTASSGGFTFPGGGFGGAAGGLGA